MAISVMDRIIQLARRLPIDPLGIVGLLLLIAIWWAVTALGWISSLFLPAPGAIVTVVRENFFSSNYLDQYNLRGGLQASLIYTSSNVLIALLISCFIGVFLGLFTARNRLGRAIFDPIILTAGTIPILVTAPFFLIWFGTARIAQILLLVLYGTTVIYLYAQRAADNLNPVYVDASRTLGASQLRILFNVFLIGTLPEVFGGIRIALAGSWGLEAFSELLGARSGIGRIIQAMATSVDTLTMMASILTLSAVAFGFDIIVAIIFRILTRWRPQASL